MKLNYYKQELKKTATALAKSGKGILAVDESTKTIGKRFASINNKIKFITFYNLADIPVSLFLYKNFEKKDIEIIGLYEKENQIKIRIRHKKRNDESFLEIVFEKNPFLMKKWTIFQNATNKIEVLLNTLIVNEKNFITNSSIYILI